MGYAYAVAAVAAWTVLAFTHRRATSARCRPMFQLAALGLAALGLDAVAMAALGVNPLSIRPALLVLALAGGAVAIVNLLSFLAAVARGELAISWTIMTLAFAGASVLCMIYPDQPVSLAGWVGLALAAGAVVLLGSDMRRRRASTKAAAARPVGARKGWGAFMAVAFLTNVCTLYMFRLCAELMPAGDDSQTLPFLAVLHAVFGLAGLALGLLGLGSGRVRPALIYGSIGGAMLVAGGGATVLAMASGELPGSLLLPITNGGSALAVTVLSVIFLHERPGWSGRAGIAAGIAGMLLLGWATA